MNHQDYAKEREARDPSFAEACERKRPQVEFRKALIGRDSLLVLPRNRWLNAWVPLRRR